ncbi:hypothetical protein [Allonocardiopsis opalescens]|uniref:Spermidine synthase n=1 Tax=Allonocardiopsis opalescens TaxID=1144618 RepID=A0A2T0PU43_9ACTN|nr:hypothetical protein [Allonocardiopsis opalescens]PRX92413.1 hypothetical protein CLV72_110173 [Allonocardiopsis opalescens]
MTTVEEAEAPSVSGPLRPRVWLLNTLFTSAILLSALLLFAVQPMVAKMLLPPYGGASSVWTTSVLFFQVVLLAGYAYSHYVPRLLGRWHPLLHIALLLAPLAVLPVTLPAWAAPGESVPVAAWLLLVLAVMVGLPFAVVSTTGPLAQAWYATLGLPRSRDPYFLYAASNVGSLVALVAYPFAVEPVLEVGEQAVWWAVGYGAFVVLLGACGIVTWRRARSTAGAAPAAEAAAAAPARATTRPKKALKREAAAAAAAVERLGWRRRLRWLALAALPSSLMLGVTTHMSTDVAAVPLLWVLPLALYLGTFIIAFGTRRHGWVAGAVDAAAVCCLPVLLIAAMPDLVGIPTAMVLSMGVLTVVSLAAHGLLAADRPSPAHLTEYFLLVSLGGALGSLFNGVVAPVVFDRVLEYPIALVAAVLLLAMTRTPSGLVAKVSGRAWVRFGLIGAALATAYLAMVLEQLALLLATFALGAAWAVLSFASRRGLGAAVLAALGGGLVLAMTIASAGDGVLLRGRTFFGSYVVRQGEDYRSLSHGTTVHGTQLLDPIGRRTPVSYYSRSGPLGDVFAGYGAPERSPRIAVVGLGTGAVAAYGQAGQQFDFYEIDPEMVDVATDPDLFSYLDDCLCETRTIVGDGRLALSEAEAGYGVIVLDAFTSDAIPAHLLTREALTAFADRLAPGGVIALHISNRALDLEPMVGATARSAGLTALTRTAAGSEPQSSVSQWVVIGRSEADLAPLGERSEDWRPLPEGGPVWTDTYSSLFGVIRWD